MIPTIAIGTGNQFKDYWQKQLEKLSLSKQEFCERLMRLEVLIKCEPKPTGATYKRHIGNITRLLNKWFAFRDEPLKVSQKKFSTILFALDSSIEHYPYLQNQPSPHHLLGIWYVYHIDDNQGVCPKKLVVLHDQTLFYDCLMIHPTTGCDEYSYGELKKSSELYFSMANEVGYHHAMIGKFMQIDGSQLIVGGWLVYVDHGIDMHEFCASKTELSDKTVKKYLKHYKRNKRLT